jgi:hypothetical protein
MSVFDAAPSLLRAVRSRTAPVAKTALLRLGGYTAFRRIVPSRGAAILRYHAICGDEGAAYADPSICVSPVNFERHVRYLAAHYAVLPLPEVVERLGDGTDGRCPPTRSRSRLTMAIRTTSRRRARCTGTGCRRRFSSPRAASAAPSRSGPRSCAR